MGLTLVTDEETGISKYEYQKEEEKKPEIEIPQQSLGESLTDFSRLGELQSDWAETLSADEDDNVIEGVLKSAARMPFNAAVETLQEGSDVIRDFLGDTTGLAPGMETTYEEQDKGILGLGDWKPANASSEGMNELGRTAEQFGTSVVQFMTMFRLLGVGLRTVAPGVAAKFAGVEGAIQTGAAAKVGGGFLGNRVVGPLAGAAFNSLANPKGMVVDYAGFNQWDGRFYDLLANSNTFFNNIKHIPLVNQLESNPDDSATEGRAKNIFEGILVDQLVGTAFKAFRGIGYTPKTKDLASLAVDTTKARGYGEQLLEATQRHGEGSPQYIAVKNKINKLIEKVGNNPIIRALSGEQRTIPQNRIDQLPDAKNSFALNQVDNRIAELEAGIKQLGDEPIKPAKGTYFELIDGKKRRTEAAVNYQRDRRSRTRLTKELEQLQAKRETLLEQQKVDTTDELGPEPTDPKERLIYDRKKADIDRANPDQPTPSREYTREQIERATKAVDVLVDPKTKKPFTPEQKRVFTQRFLETKFGRLDRSARNPNRAFEGIPDHQKASFIESRWALLSEIVEKIAGKDFKTRWFETYQQGRQTGDYGDPSAIVDIQGQYDFVDDVIDLYGLISGNESDLIRTAFHEPFHRVQLVALDKKQIRVLDSAWARLKVALANVRTKDELGMGDAPLSYMEGMTFAFERYGAAKLFGKDPITALLPGPGYRDNKTLIRIVEKIISLFDPILDLVEKTYNYVSDPKGKGFQSIRSIFEDAYSGKLADVVQPEVAGERARAGMLRTEMDKLPETLPRDAKEAADALGTVEAINELKGWISDSAERSLMQPGGLWRTRDEGYRKINIGEKDLLDVGDPLQRVGGSAEDFNFPPGRYNTRYGQAEIIFKSSLDKAAWLIRAGKKQLPKTYQKLIEALEEQGHDIAELRILGDELHDLIKDGIKNETGSAKAGANTAGVKLEVQPSIREEGADGFRSDDPYEIPEEPTPRTEPEPEGTAPDQEVGRAEYEVREENVSGLSEDFLENVRKFENDEIELKDLFNDIIAIESPSGRLKYGVANPNMRLLWDAVARKWNRVRATGMPAIDMEKLKDALLKEAENNGLNSSQIQALNLKLSEALANNVENVSNLITLRMLVQKTSEELGAKAMGVLNAMATGSANYPKIGAEFQLAVAAALGPFRQYQQITRGAAQILRSTQADIGDLSGVQLKEGGGFSLNAEDIIEGMSRDQISDIFPAEILEANRTGNWTPQAKKALYNFADTMATEAAHPGVGIKSLDDAIQGPNPGTGHDFIEGNPRIMSQKEKLQAMPLDEKVFRTLGAYRINNLLTAPFTWAVQTAIPTARLFTEPVVMVVGRTLTRKGLIDLKAGRQAIDIAGYWYLQMWLQAMGALRQGRRAFMLGHTLYDPYRRSSAWDLNHNEAIAKAQGINKAMEIDETNPAYNLNEFPLAKEIGKNPNLKFVANAMHRFATFDIRTQGAIETAQKQLIGVPFTLVEGLEQGLVQAQREGLSGAEAWHYAEDWAQQHLKEKTHDAVINGQLITDAISTDESALKLGRILTFTDDIRATMPERTIAFGQELARKNGIEGDDAINDYAIKYKEGKIDRYGRTREGGTEGLSAYMASIHGRNTLPLGGEATPAWRGLHTGTLSTIPRVWSKLQRARFGYIATLIQSFNRSPGDIFKQVLRHTPAHMMTDTGYRDFFDESSHLSKRWKSEVAVGATVSAAMIGLWTNDNIKINGAGPSNPEAYRVWREAGNYPFTIMRKIGADENGFEVWETVFSYRGYEPIATIIQMFADYKLLSTSLTEDERDALGSSLPATLAGMVINGQLQSSYYEGISKFIDMVMSWGGRGVGRIPTQEGETNKTQRYFNDLLLSMIPGARTSHMRHLTQELDEKQRITPRGGRRKVVDPEGEGYFEFPGSGEPGSEGYIPPFESRYSYEGPEGWLANSFFHLVNQFKKNNPLFSKTLPQRRNWITFEPLINPGYLADEQLPFESDPWYLQLGTGFLLTTLPVVMSAVPLVGALPQFQGRKMEPQSLNNKKTLVMNELMRLKGMGSNFMPPDPSDLISGTTLSAPAYEQYLRYIADTPNKGDRYTGMKLYEALYYVMSSDTYQNAPPDLEVGRKNQTSPRMDMVREVLDVYRKQGRWLFFNDPKNKFIIEVLEKYQNNEEWKQKKKEYRLYGGPTSSNNDKVSPSEYVASLN